MLPERVLHQTDTPAVNCQVVSTGSAIREDREDDRMRAGGRLLIMPSAPFRMLISPLLFGC